MFDSGLLFLVALLCFHLNLLEEFFALLIFFSRHLGVESSFNCILMSFLLFLDFLSRSLGKHILKILLLSELNLF